MKRKKPPREEKYLESRKLGRILLVGMLLVFLSTPIISYLMEHDMKALAALLNTARFFYLLLFFGYGLSSAIRHPPLTRKVNKKEREIMKTLIVECAEDVSLESKEGKIETLELLDCVEKKLEQKGIFYITSPQISNCIEQAFSNQEPWLANIEPPAEVDKRKRKIWRFLAYYATFGLPGGFILWVLGSTRVLYLEYYVQIGYFMIFSAMIAIFCSIELRTNARSQF
jgi:hypothetical protein